jgi:hypothetical protein
MSLQWCECERTTNSGTLATCVANSLDDSGVSSNLAGQKAERKNNGGLSEKHLEPVK